MTKEIKQEQGKLLAWLIDDKSINHLQIKTIQRLIERANHAHMTDIKLRINGQDEWYEGDWIKHMVEAPQPNQEQDKPVAIIEVKNGKAWLRYEIFTGLVNGLHNLYTKPQTKEWVRLTEEELIVIKGKTCPEIDWSARHGVPLNNGEQNAWLFSWFMAFAKETEVKLKEKNR